MTGSIKRWVIVLGATIILAGSTVGAVAFAQTPTPATPGTAQKTDYRQVFLGKLAALLGVDQQKLTDAAKQAGKDTVDEAVKNGDLTQAQADKVKSRIDQGQGGFGFPGRFGFGPGGPHGKGFRGGAAMEGQVVLKAAADKLGMTEQELLSALRSGKSLSDVAKEKNVSLQDVQSAMVAAAKPQLDQAVKDGKLTQQQEDEILQRIQQGNWPGFHGMWGGMRGRR